MMKKFCLLVIFCCNLIRLSSYVLNSPIIRRRTTRPSIVIVQQTSIDMNALILSSIFISSYIISQNVQSLNRRLSGDIHAVNDSLSANIGSVRKDLQYLQMDNGFTVELTIRNFLASTVSLEYSQKYDLRGIPSLISWFPVNQRFSTETSVSQEYPLTSRQRALSAFCTEKIDSLAKSNSKFGDAQMATVVSKTLRKFNGLSEEGTIEKLINEDTSLPIMVLSSIVTDPLKEMERRNAIVYSSLDLDISGDCNIFPDDSIQIKIGECKTTASEEAVLKGCYQLALRLAVLANVALSISSKSNGYLKGILYFRDGTRGAAQVGRIINNNIDKIKAEIIFPLGFELELTCEFV